VNAASQWTTIGWMILCGFAMGLAFDLYRVVSNRFRIPRWLFPALDIVFWAAATLGVFKVLLGHNNGEVRLYVFLGLGIGVTGYFGLFSTWIARTFARILDLVVRLASWFWKMLRMLAAAPVMALVRGLAKLLDILFVVLAALLLWMGRLLLIPLRPVGRYAWRWLLPVRRKARSWMEAAARLRGKLKAAWQLFRRK
jgi:spore cortex biosynthesis protein YabQ